MTRPVTMPVAFAFFIAVLVNPMQHWLEQRLPRWLSLGIVMAMLLAVLAIFAGAIELSLELIEPQIPQYADQAQQFLQSARTWLQNHGLPHRAEWPGECCSISGISAGCWWGQVSVDGL